MRGDPDRLRGEAARVAARVETLLREYHLDAARRPPAAAPSWLDAAMPVVSDEALILAEPAEPLVPARVAPWLDEPVEWEAPTPSGRAHPVAPAVEVARATVAEGLAEAATEAEAEPPDRPDRPRWWQRLAGRVPVRLDPGRRSAIAVGLAVLVAAVITGVWLVSTRPRALPVASTSSTSPTSSSFARSDAASQPSGGGPSAPVSDAVSTPAAVVVVDVAGKVRHPGVYRLAAGTRVVDAIRAAGGAKHGVDLSGLNLAATLVDGQQVAVGVTPAPGGGGDGGSGGGSGGGSASGGSAAAGPVDLNTASLEQLETLPGVGPVLGQHILDYRTQHGGFSSVDQLRNVSGIGDVRFTQLRPLVTA